MLWAFDTLTVIGNCSEMRISMGFIKNIQNEIKVIRDRDPAIHSDMEVFLYPSFKVMLSYRIAHKLYKNKHYFLARWVSQRAVRKTGIEIHPGAEIGENFFCSNNKLVSLKGCPKKVGGVFYFENNKGKRFTKSEVEKVCKVGNEIYV